ncbi:hypothetical protein L596_009377 [Steinernema carpocapsae]|uniref:DDE Tnp4 domain-containing protein n=1 Tax=Steinernema carpocapsae TaxID=34508 RepID=A0A4U5PGH1_STECR|nr:hypothetical protein L596_009377 [Steinernema carpocapsae]
MDDTEEQLKLLLELWRLHKQQKKAKQRCYINETNLANQDQRFQLFEESYHSENPEDLKEFLHVGRDDFDALHELLEEDLTKRLNHRFPIGSKQRLAVFLRFVSHGPSFRSVESTFSIGRSTVKQITEEVVAAINVKLGLPAPSLDQWMTLAEGFEHRWDFPNCVGALDGRHFVIRAPTGEMSDYLDYNGSYSVTGHALVDAFYRFVRFDVSVPGTPVNLSILDPKNLPEVREVNGYVLPFVAVTDQGFASSPSVLKLFGPAEASTDPWKTEFNCRLTRAMQVTENAFSLLASRFDVLHSPLQLSPEKSGDLILSLALLHNFLRTQEMIRGEEPEEIQEEAKKLLMPLGEESSRSTSVQARRKRADFVEYFVSPEGKISWEFV